MRGQETFRDPCPGTPGSGNHFVGMQVVDAIQDCHAAYEAGLKVGDVVGATPAREGDFALIPGSMGDHSYVARGLGHADWLWSCSHGAGRRLRRQEMRARAVHDQQHTHWECVTLREERRIEEAPEAYKPIGPVIEAQEDAGLISAVA